MSRRIERNPLQGCRALAAPIVLEFLKRPPSGLEKLKDIDFATQMDLFRLGGIALEAFQIVCLAYRSGMGFAEDDECCSFSSIPARRQELHSTRDQLRAWYREDGIAAMARGELPPHLYQQNLLDRRIAAIDRLEARMIPYCTKKVHRGDLIWAISLPAKDELTRIMRHFPRAEDFLHAVAEKSTSIAPTKYAVRIFGSMITEHTTHAWGTPVGSKKANERVKDEAAFRAAYDAAIGAMPGCEPESDPHKKSESMRSMWNKLSQIEDATIRAYVGT
jgi:hypothetical protein